MRGRLGAGLLLAVCLVGVPTAAHAEDPVQFGADHILDKAGVLGDRADEVEAAISTLYDETRVDLFIAYVDSFTGVDDSQRWADVTFDSNGMGASDVLLAVAAGDRQYQLSVAPDFALTDAQLAEVESVAIEPALHENDWAGAGIGAAEGLAASLQGQPVTTPDITPGEAAPAPSSGGGGWGVFWLIVVAAIVIGAIIFFARRGKKAAAVSKAPAGPPPVPTDTLRQRAGRALVETDDAVKTSEQELGFAVAAYGTDSTAPFRTALATAKGQLRDAFTLQQKLDDAVPDTEAQQRDWYQQIIALCEKANDELDEQAEAFDQLRALEKNAPAAAASVAQEADAVEPGIADAEKKVHALAAGYSDAAVATVADNPEQARERLVFARDTLEKAQASLAGGDTSTAAVGIRAAEEAVDQAKLLVQAVDTLGASLQKAAQGVMATIADLETDLVSARALVSGNRVPVDAAGGISGVVATTQHVVDEAKSALASGKTNPLDLVQRLQEANTRMDAVLKGVRDAEVQAQRTREALNQTFISADSRVSAAEDFITARRGAVGPEARTRVAEARRLLGQAQAEARTDPARALTTANRANSLAADAAQLAQDDVAGFGGFGQAGYGPVGYGRGGYGGGGGGMGAILGGILIGSVLGGGGGGGGMFGGGGGGDFGGFGGSGGFGGGGHRGGGGRF
ncbi:TPM domain-containing protein [Cryobacterium tepidiphilum]|uniref:TPM domain-containing protein n=1 Tax=Cryobacterium tepidiphilum TaxID=2486026 RepID=A0A3M8LFM3_9MICO|nr:TPM domain-containing protein [Cryobacterium tepidiphilum]RNE63612.1 TPM domain-containing protein [Cryobacterium tepidiphilum]